MNKQQPAQWMPEDWQKIWDGNAGQPDDLGATGRGGMGVIGFLHTVISVADLLNLSALDRLLDIGCGTGLFALALSPCVASVHGVDISEKMIQRAKDNCHTLSDITFSTGTLNNPDTVVIHYNKILVNSVLQYLPDLAAAFQSIGTIYDLLPAGGRALLAANPDPRCKEIFWNKTFEGRDEKTRKKIVELNEQTLWADPEELARVATGIGFSAHFQPVTERIWQHCYMYDLILDKP
jgi:SAM-dependent methyltransferase